MCGISCIISSNELHHQYILSMNDLVIHRGPDHAGVCSYGPVSLGHRRLSIIDLSLKGNQPMSAHGYTIVYNGEIYNYKELIDELRVYGYTFNTETDTEVICAAYHKWGSNCLNHFNGMFAFIICSCDNSKDDNNNKNTTKLTLNDKYKIFYARDRFGIKPLYYWNISKDAIAFSSEIKQFTKLPLWDATMNHARVRDFLVYGLIDHTDETMFEGVFQVPAGHCGYIEIEDNKPSKPLRPLQKLSHIRWYIPETFSYKFNLNTAKNTFYHLFTDSVRIRLRSDVPVGSCLSGGLDSSSIVTVVNRIKEGTVLQNTFTACAHDPKFDERKCADYVSDSLRLTAHHIYPEYDDLIKTLETLIWHQDEPIQSTSMFAQWEVFRAAKESGVTVMLDGQGADELLAGYLINFPILFNTCLQKQQFVDLLIQMISAKWHHRDINLLSNAYIFLERLAISKNSFNTLQNSVPWINLSCFNIKEDKNNLPTFNYEDLTSHLEAQLYTTSLPALLHWEDRNSMAHSIEARVPFLDYRLVEFVQSLPLNYKINHGITKIILREAMKGILPEKIRMRMDKKGFVTPEELWVKKHAPELRFMFLQTIEKMNGILTPDALKKFDRIIENKEPFSFWIWRIISLGVWMKVFNIKINSFK